MRIIQHIGHGMRAGELNKIISIEQKGTTSDGMGGFTEAYTTVASSVYAAIWTVSAKERIQSAKETMDITHRIRIRYRTGITAGMRVKYKTSYYNIKSIINPNMANEMLEILAAEVV